MTFVHRRSAFVSYIAAFPALPGLPSRCRRDLGNSSVGGPKREYMVRQVVTGRVLREFLGQAPCTRRSLRCCVRVGLSSAAATSSPKRRSGTTSELMVNVQEDTGMQGIEARGRARRVSEAARPQARRRATADVVAGYWPSGPARRSALALGQRCRPRASSEYGRKSSRRLRAPSTARCRGRRTTCALSRG